MATDPVTTGAPTCASVLNSAVAAFETIQGDFGSLHGLLRIISSEFGPGNTAGEAVNLTECALLVAASIEGKFTAAIDAAYDGRREAA